MRSLSRAALAALVLIGSQGAALAGASDAYAALRSAYARASDTGRQLSEQEADGLVSYVGTQTTTLAAAPGSIKGLPNHIAAYRIALRIAALLYHGHGWASKASQVASSAKAAIQPHDANLASYVDNRISWLDQADDGVRLDVENPYFPDGPPGGGGATNDCSIFDETAMQNKAQFYVMNDMLQEVTGVAATCVDSDPQGLAQATVESVAPDGRPQTLLFYVSMLDGTVTPR